MARRDNEKQRQLDDHRVKQDRTRYTTDQGIPIDDTDNSVKIGERGPTLLEDFHFREKVMRFDHERIPERVVHARGSGAHGEFRVYESLEDITCADFLCDPSLVTPTFVRFSTVNGERGSADTVRDVRGFATKFYTREGNYDLVANNFPVFPIQDGIKFPDFVHALKPEPRNQIPQAQSAHDTFWDFVQEQPETMHFVMWLMSDRAIPRSYRMMQGFGVHSFRFVNAEGKGTFVKFHWRPVLGTYSLVWDEVLRLQGNDPDYNRRDLWEAIDKGAYPEFELCVQLVDEKDEHKFDFDLLDSTKIIPEEEVPLRPIGKMVLNRNPQNFFAETEQVAFCTANIVPGIDFSNDPLLQARNFSYLDTQLIRLGGPNHQQLPINRPVAPVHNDNRDGFHQHMIHDSDTAYSRNSIGGNYPKTAKDSGKWEGVYKHYQEHVAGEKIRRRSPSFEDHYSQATLFWNSMSSWEKSHIVEALLFELGQVQRRYIKEKVVERLANVDKTLATQVATGLGFDPPSTGVTNHGKSSPALSMTDQPKSVATRQIAVLVGEQSDPGTVRPVLQALRDQGAVCDIIAPREGTVATFEVDKQLSAANSVVYDAVLAAGGRELIGDGEAVQFLREAFKHYKAVGVLPGAEPLLEAAELPGREGVVDASAGEAFAERFADAVAAHRHWSRNVSSFPA